MCVRNGRRLRVGTIIIARHYSYALMTASLHGVSDRIPIDLLTAGTLCGQPWSWALGHARHARSALERAKRLCALVQHAPASDRHSILREAFDEARSAKAKGVLPEALAHLFTDLIPQFPEDLLQEAHSDVEQWPDYFSPRGYFPKRAVLDAVATAFARLGRYGEALRAAGESVPALLAVARLLPPELVEQAVVQASSIAHEKSRREALVGLIPRLPFARAIREAMALPRVEITLETPRADALYGIAEAAADEERAIALKMAIAEANRVQPTVRIRAIARLLPLRPVAQRTAAARRLMTRIRRIANKQQRYSELSSIMCYLPAADRPSAIGLMVEANLAVPGGEKHREDLLRAAARYWPEPTRDEILVLTRGLPEEGRNKVMAAVVARLPPGERYVVFRELLAAIPDSGDGEAQIRAIARLVVHVMPDQAARLKADAVRATRGLGDLTARATALTAIAELPPRQDRHALVVEALQTIKSGARSDFAPLREISHLLDRRTVEPALDVVATLDGTQKLGSLLDVLNVMPAGPPSAVIDQCLELADACGASDRLYVLERIAPYLTRQNLDQAWQLLGGLDDPLLRCEALIHMWRPLPAHARGRALRCALADLDKIAKIVEPAYPLLRALEPVRELAKLEHLQVREMTSVRPVSKGWGKPADQYLRIIAATRQLPGVTARK
jgi:hypothetical protein